MLFPSISITFLSSTPDQKQDFADFPSSHCMLLLQSVQTSIQVLKKRSIAKRFYKLLMSHFNLKRWSLLALGQGRILTILLGSTSQRPTKAGFTLADIIVAVIRFSHGILHLLDPVSKLYWNSSVQPIGWGPHRGYSDLNGHWNSVKGNLIHFACNVSCHVSCKIHSAI